MSVFDKKVEQAEFERYQAAIKAKFDSLEQEVRSKVTDSEEIVRAAATNSVALEATIKEKATAVEIALKTLEGYRDEVAAELNRLQEQRTAVEESNKNLLASTETTQKLHAQIVESKNQVDAAAADILSKMEKIRAIQAESQQLPESVASTKQMLEEAETLKGSIQDLLDHSIKRKAEIDDLHKEIYGTDVKGSEGKAEHVDGLKDELGRSYERIVTQAGELETNIKGLVGSITEKHTAQLDIEKSVFDKLIADSSTRINAVKDELEALLPGALAAGLSASYESKKNDEITSFKTFETTFKYAIGGMVFISLIPFFVDIYLLHWKGGELVQVIKDTWSLIFSILPLYFPILWLALSSNKKMNLSKRLIEEYTHKAVLGKTFSGLSNQIEMLPHQSAVREELRTQLLFNVLQVSAENPGKLISNYNKSDHPLMEALESSAKLSDAVEALSRLPGFAAIAKKLSTKSEDLLKTQEMKVAIGLDTQVLLEAPGNSAPMLSESPPPKLA